MEKLNTTSLTELNGIEVELGVTKVRADKFEEGLYIIPIFINEIAMIAHASEGGVQPMQTGAPWELYDEALHGEGNLKYITPEEFYEKIKTGEDACYYIMETFDDLLSKKKYDVIIDILANANLDDFEEGGIGLWMMTSSNPVSPLMRPIPGEDNIEDLITARHRFFEKCEPYYLKEKDKKEAEQLIKSCRPRDYKKEVESYDALYMGGAPKE